MRWSCAGPRPPVRNPPTDEPPARVSHHVPSASVSNRLPVVPGCANGVTPLIMEEPHDRTPEEITDHPHTGGATARHGRSGEATPQAIEQAAAVEPSAGELRQPATRAEGAPRRQWQPDPFPLMTISLGAKKDSPRMTLYRSNKLNQMAIRFDEKPEEEHRVQLRETGWRWREDEGVWTKQMDRERRATSQMEAERLFTEIGETIRAARGLSGRSDVGG